MFDSHTHIQPLDLTQLNRNQHHVQANDFTSNNQRHSPTTPIPKSLGIIITATPKTPQKTYNQSRLKPPLYLRCAVQMAVVNPICVYVKVHRLLVTACKKTISNQTTPRYPFRFKLVAALIVSSPQHLRQAPKASAHRRTSTVAGRPIELRQSPTRASEERSS